MIIHLMTSQSLMAQKKKDFYGNWNFEAPTVPPGFESGSMIIKKDSVFTKYQSDPNIYPSSYMRIKSDTLTFVLNPGAIVTCKLTIKNKAKLIGTAVWDGGETVLNLTKIEKQK